MPCFEQLLDIYSIGQKFLRDIWEGLGRLKPIPPTFPLCDPPLRSTGKQQLKLLDALVRDITLALESKGQPAFRVSTTELKLILFVRKFKRLTPSLLKSRIGEFDAKKS
jgi:hypothetical protein